MKFLPLTALALAMAAQAVHAADDGGPAVVPYRPSVSTPAQLSAPGYLELEAGGLRASDNGASRTTLPYTDRKSTRLNSSHVD